jgi:uncharacterized protein YndB with AHSA1/START domain
VAKAARLKRKAGATKPKKGSISMPDIKHAIQIAAEPGTVHPLVATAEGFTKWWAADVTVDKSTGNVDLGFFNRATVYGLKPVQTAEPREVQWLCRTGKEWSGTRLLFELAEQKGQTLLRFAHAGWEAETDYFVMCNTTWGELMYRLKAAAEGKNPEPLFSKSGLAY